MYIYITVYNGICSATYMQYIYIFIYMYIVEYADNISVGQDWIPRLGGRQSVEELCYFLKDWIVRIGGLDSSLCDLKQPRR